LWLVRRLCAELEIGVLAGNIRCDHVHLLLSYPPQLSVSKLVQKLKGVTSRKLLQESACLKKGYLGLSSMGQRLLCGQHG